MAQLSGRTSLVFADVFGVEFFELFFIRINFLQCARKFIGAHRCGRGNLPASVLFSFHTIIIPHNAGRYTQKCAFGRELSGLLYLVASLKVKSAFFSGIALSAISILGHFAHALSVISTISLSCHFD